LEADFKKKNHQNKGKDLNTATYILKNKIQPMEAHSPASKESVLVTRSRGRISQTENLKCLGLPLFARNLN
jgi:hypothetical protein